ncbi:MAG: methyl-accepting chemotaxis protein [Nitrospinota bacterium]|nr:methyl-accepting chemotaxis protein [Nitrospinota bacterium]
MKLRILGNIRIQTRLLVVLGMLVIIPMISTQVGLRALDRIYQSMDKITGQYYPLAEAAMEMKFAVLEVQNHFTRDSLSMKKDDDRSDVEKWQQHFKRYADKAISLSQDADKKKEIGHIVLDFNQFFKMAELMSLVYIERGPEEGAGIKVDVDAFVKVLRGRIDKVVANNKSELVMIMEETGREVGVAEGTAKMVSLLVAAATFILAYLLANSITSPLKRIVDRLRAIAKDEVADLSKSVDVATSDEISDVGNLFNEFVMKVRKIVTQLGSMAEHLASATTQLSTTTERFSKQANSQSFEVAKIYNSVEEVNTAINAIAKSAADVAMTSEETRKQAMEGGSIIEQSSEAIGKLSDYSTKIGSILLVIEDIAKKTDLLAINAAIEAANAGEQGRGFAVVAEEVRKLAERTTKATGEIGRIIKDIQGFTSEAVESMRGSGDAMNRIIYDTAKVNEMVDHIAAATEKQSGITNIMFANIKTVNQLSEGFAYQSDETKKVALEINEEIYKLQAVVDQFKV